MRQWNIEKLKEELYWDTLLHGTCFLSAHRRKWWNPMRLLFGDFKLVRIAPADFFRDGRTTGSRHG